MGAEKIGIKAVGFFHLFDWNKKPRKKLFANGTVSPEVAKQGAKSNESVEATRLHFAEDVDPGGQSGLTVCTGYSCASSVTDEEGKGNRAPGVVARLMGLDSLPTAGVSESCPAPLFDSQSLRENNYQKRVPEILIGDKFSHAEGRSEYYSRKPLEVRSQKMPSSPIERFSTEVLPLRSAKPLPVPNHKLLSPIKNPSFTSGKNVAHIMEAAVKILEPGLKENSKGKAPSLGSSSLSLEVHNSKESTATSHGATRFTGSSQKPLESIAVECIRGHPLNKSWSEPEEPCSARDSPEWEETSSTSTKDKGKTVSLAIQAKVNVQRREGSSAYGKSISVPREHEEAKLNQTFKEEWLKTWSLRHAKQNNQKQNSLSSKEKITAMSSLSDQQIRKASSGDAKSGKNRTLKKTQGNSKKRLVDGNYQSQKNIPADSIIVGRHEKRVQSGVVVDEHQKWDEDIRRNGTDIVSFTFTSPMNKSVAGSQPNHTIMHGFNSDNSSVGVEIEMNDDSAESSKWASIGLNKISGDALSFLLEQKLRELSHGLESSEVGSTSASFPTSASVSEDSCITQILHQKGTVQESSEMGICNFSDALSSASDRLFNHSSISQAAESVTGCSTSGKEPEQQHPSPLSILEASFSSESCSSSESCESRRDPQGGRDGPLRLGLLPSAVPLEERRPPPPPAPATEEEEEEIEYVRRVVARAGGAPPSLDPRLFDLLEDEEEKKARSTGDGGRLRRKALFDCVGEWLVSSFQDGGAYRRRPATTAAGSRCGEVAEQICRELAGWRGMGDWMVDELVERDMTRGPGRWLDFQAEAFEAAVDMEEALVASLVAELLSDFGYYRSPLSLSLSLSLSSVIFPLVVVTSSLS
ncbi:unnamed protein product [Spirodela intermedia]|uniref:Uncharacterized protein n=1 Tax=Spirodela intermedia TaxID=51605 RepID=A0A7I8JHX9_SPIIN|nr:unnamed protein product [Spirodela intermedia]CAA6669153.1 unnamed protein product [Spirodela intermedia]